MSNQLNTYKPGFFLVELLISLAIMSALWLVITQYQSTVIRITSDAQQRMKAINVASSMLDQVMLHKKIPANSKHNDFQVSWDKQSISSSDLKLPSKSTFDLVTVHVAWGTQNNQSIQLATGILFKQEA